MELYRYWFRGRDDLRDPLVRGEVPPPPDGSGLYNYDTTWLMFALADEWDGISSGGEPGSFFPLILFDD